MKALEFIGINQPLVYKELDKPIVNDDQVLVKNTFAALNRRDYWITKGLYPGVIYPTVLGSCGCGQFNDTSYIYNPNIHWGSNPTVPSKDYIILGLEEKGTMAEYTAVRKSSLFVKPKHLSDEQGAALPLAGLTAYRAIISNCKLKPNEKVLITGIGGGVALMAMQFALALGAEVYVTSSCSEKIEKAIQLGATLGVNYKDKDWDKQLKKEGIRFDVIIDSAGGEGFAKLVGLANRGGRIGLYGGTAGNWNDVSPQLVFFKQLHIFGSTMGNDSEFESMVKMVTTHKINPIVDRTFPLSKGNEAITYMKQSHQFGKIILDIEK